MRVPTRRGENQRRTKIDPLMTPAKFDELKDKLARIKQGIPAAAAEVQRLSLLGDFSENAEYQIAKGKLRGMNYRILELERQLADSVIIEPTTGGGIVTVGCKVTIEMNGRQKTYQILGSAESNPALGIISRSSPIGSALIGKFVGDTTRIQLANGDVTCRIVSIN